MEYFVLSAPTPRKPGGIVTKAFVLCGGCGASLDAVNGPRKALCAICWRRIELGALRVTRGEDETKACYACMDAHPPGPCPDARPNGE